MRYFRRSGPTVVVSESDNRAPRVARGPHDSEPGDVISYDDYYPDEATWAQQMAVSPGWYEVDSAGRPLAAGTVGAATRPGGEPTVETAPETASETASETAEPVEQTDVSEETPVSTTEG